MIIMKNLMIILIVFISSQTNFSQNLVLNKIILLDSPVNDFSINENKNYIFLISSQNNEIIKLNLNGNIEKRIGGFGWNYGQFDLPSAIVSTALEVYVSDYHNHRIQRFDHNLNFISLLERSDQIYFENPVSVDLSSKGDLYILDSRNKRIVKVNGFNKLERIFGNYESGKIILVNPKKLKVDKNQQVLILDGNKLLIFDQFGSFIKELNFSQGITEEIIDFLPYQNKIYLVTKKNLYCYSRELIKFNLLFEFSEEFELRGLRIIHNQFYFLSSEGLLICSEEN